MRLTNSMRNVIRDKILAGLPSEVDYQDQAQQLVWADCISQMPKDLQTAISLCPEIKNYLWAEYAYFHGASCLGLRSFKHYTPGEEIKTKVNQLHDAHEKQRDERRSIKRKLEAILDSVTTVKKFIDNFPEFEQYVPKIDEPIKNLPATTILNELAELGWKQS